MCKQDSIQTCVSSWLHWILKYTCAFANLHVVIMFILLRLQTNIEITAETDFNRLLQIEEEQVQKMCEDIIALKPDLVFTEKGVSGKATDLILNVEISQFLL